MRPIAVYRLIPSARPDDPNWDRAPNRGEVLVRAESAGEARALAAYAEVAATSGPEDLGTTKTTASAFRDEKLYHVVLDQSGKFPDEGAPGVLMGFD